MNRIQVVAVAAVSLAAAAAAAQTRPTGGVRGATIDRSAVAIQYSEGDGVRLTLEGTPLRPGLAGQANVKRKDGRTRIKLDLEPLPHPQSLARDVSTYVAWAVAPEGQTERLAELPHSRAFGVEVTTSLPTFALLVTAEPHGAVMLPGGLLMAENVVPRDGGTRARGAAASFPADAGVGAGSGGAGDFTTPLLVLGSRLAVERARAAGAPQFAEAELRQAEIKLSALEQLWPGRKKIEDEVEALARDTMRLGEQARSLAFDRKEQARLAAEKRVASESVARAQRETGLARDEAQQARLRAAQEAADAQHERAEAAQAREQSAAYRDALARAEREAEDARSRVSQAQTDAERARASEELARAEAERNRLAAEDAHRDRAALEQRLYESISAILETRREARGLIVNLSDVLFDFNRATLTAGAREKLARLAGILLAYPGTYRVAVEGHTDSVGSNEYNLQLSRDRAESVHGYLLQGGVRADRMGAAIGLGESRPVAGNDTAAGRQRNRRVEIVISDLEGMTAPVR